MGDEKPANANESCVGPSSESAGKAAGCAGCPNQSACASGEGRKANPGQAAVNETLANVGRVLLVLSGKGGVGKSTFSSQLAFGLARRGRRVGLLDVDICGPSLPLMLGLKGREVKQSASGWQPVYVDLEGMESEWKDGEEGELGVMSIGFLMSDPDSAVIWRGPKKNGLIQQFFTSVDWGTLDYLVIDTPPGTSDEHISLVQLIKQAMKPTDGAIVVTTPQEVAMMDVRKELNFCKQTSLNVIGVVENMASALLPLSEMLFVDKENGKESTKEAMEIMQKKCPELLQHLVKIQLFPPANGGPRAMAEAFKVPFLGSIPVDDQIQHSGEIGKAIPKGPSLQPIEDIITSILASDPEPSNMNNGHDSAQANGKIVVE